MNIFSDAISQYIDIEGKTRMLTFNNNISIMISPIKPLNLPIDENIYESTVKDANEFLAEYGFKIISQKVVEIDKNLYVNGYFLNHPIFYYCYLPLQNHPIIENIDIAEDSQLDPLTIDKTSELETMRLTRKISDILKIYTLYTYSLDPEEWSEDKITVIDDYKYDITKLNKRLFYQDNDIMYSDDKLIVPSQQIKNNLLKYLKTELLNDTPGILNYKNIYSIPNYYSILSDFRSSPNTLIFQGKAGIIRWKESFKKSEFTSIISPYFIYDTKEPYFYRNININKNTLAIIQNVKNGSKDIAILVSDEWQQSKINKGFFAKMDNLNKIDNISYVIYTDRGEHEKIKKGNKTAPILKYNNGMFAAILFLS